MSSVPCWPPVRIWELAGYWDGLVSVVVGVKQVKEEDKKGT